MKISTIALGCLLIAAPVAAQQKESGKAVTIQFIKFKSGAMARVDEIELTCPPKVPQS